MISFLEIFFCKFQKSLDESHETRFRTEISDFSVTGKSGFIEGESDIDSSKNTTSRGKGVHQ